VADKQAWHFVATPKAPFQPLVGPRLIPPKGWADWRVNNQQLEAHYGADRIHTDPPPALLSAVAELWASWHELVREEAENIFGTSHRKAGWPAKFKQQTIGKIASEKKPIRLQKRRPMAGGVQKDQ
jgi:hypothetical protein